jgi:hypothetical protein
MDTKNKQPKIHHEFAEFMAIEDSEIPTDFSAKVRQNIINKLNPSSYKTFGKISLIHFFVGGVVLLLCPQLGIAPGLTPGLMGVFMAYGHKVCTLVCGALFLGGSTLVAGAFLSLEEWNLIWRSRYLQVVLLSLISLSALFIFGAEATLTIALIWAIGSLLGGLFGIGLSSLLFHRRKFL